MNSFEQSTQAIEQEFKQQYYNIQFIGKGAFSNVFKAKDSKTNEVVAIKVIDLTIQEKEIIPYMKNEVELLQKSNNENVIRLIDQKITDQTIFLILEYCQLDVATMSRKYFTSKVPEDLVVVILRQIANGLHYLHTNKIIHRDLKLENFAIQMTPEDFDNLTQNKDLKVFKRAQFKLIDFGLSKQFTTQNQTTKTWAGSELNMAPEILEEKPYSLQADMYSFGVCIYLMITGKFPFYDQTQRTQQQDLIKQCKADFELIQKQPLRDLVRRMLIYDPNQRITWKELYEHQLFTNEIGQVLTPLDIKLKQNSQIYKLPQKSDVVKFQQEEEEYKSFNSRQQQQIDENSLCIYQPTKNERQELNNCLLILNRFQLSVQTAEKLQQILRFSGQNGEGVRYFSMQAEYEKYIEYLMQLSQQIHEQLQQKQQSMEQNYGVFQEFKEIKEQIEHNPLIAKYNELKQIQLPKFSMSQLALRMRKEEIQIICLPHEDPYYLDQFVRVNKQMYGLILRMLQDIFYKNLEKNDNLNELRCLLYQCLISIARQRYLLVNNEIQDQKLEEIEIQDYKNEPDLLSGKVTELLEKYNLHYDF